MTCSLRFVYNYIPEVPLQEMWIFTISDLVREALVLKSAIKASGSMPQVDLVTVFRATGPGAV